MSETFDQLPSAIQVHIKNITASAGLPDDEESYERLAKGWQEKEVVFTKELSEQRMVEVTSLKKENSKGAIALTYSGSLVLIGPLLENKRKCGYNSIGIRKDVPKTIVDDESILAEDIQVHQPIKFEKGPIQSTSAIYKIAICEDELEVLEEQEKISEVTIMVAGEFADINKALVPL